MARLIAVLVLLLFLAPSAMAESSRHAIADFDWFSGLWHRLTAWISGISGYVIPSGVQAAPHGVGAYLIPSGVQAAPHGVGAYLIPEGIQAPTYRR